MPMGSVLFKRSVATADHSPSLVLAFHLATSVGSEDHQLSMGTHLYLAVEPSQKTIVKWFRTDFSVPMPRKPLCVSYGIRFGASCP